MDEGVRAQAREFPKSSIENRPSYMGSNLRLLPPIGGAFLGMDVGNFAKKLKKKKAYLEMIEETCYT